jgi:outer membrane protein
MRTYVRAACLALTITVLAASGAVAQGAPRLGYINSQLVLQQAPGRTALEAQLKTQMAPFEKRMTVMQDSIEAMTAAYLKEKPTLTAAVQAQREEAIDKKRKAFSQEAEDLSQKAADARETVSRPLMEMFNRILNELRAEEGFSFIFDVGTPDAQVIVAADKNLDLTEKVIARMRTAAATKPAATAPKPAGGPVQAPTGVKPPPPR